jgi:hypothetical protein
MALGGKVVLCTSMLYDVNIGVSTEETFKKVIQNTYQASIEVNNTEVVSVFKLSEYYKESALREKASIPSYSCRSDTRSRRKNKRSYTSTIGQNQRGHHKVCAIPHKIWPEVGLLPV